MIAITPGDPGGIGPEVIAKTFRAFPKSQSCRYLLIGSRAPFEFLEKRFGLKLKIDFLEIDQSGFDAGQISKRNAVTAYRSLEIATRLARQGKIQALVTAPVNKSAMKLVDKNFHGHTEFLAARAAAKQFAMMFVSNRLKVTLVTIHVPLASVSRLLKPDMIFEKIFLTDRFLKKYFKMKSPRLAVCALNPHGRECGTEEDRVIVPALKKAKRSGIRVEGPLPGDQVFFDAYHGKYDGVISMYHDQGLAPFKLIAFRDGVNVTLGLPYIRTSPDHGTAFDIAYQGKADPVSFQSALGLAEKLVR
ncbi:MAG: 4-hydroxythreonine-4-phosphate dehydrogenase PdxA [Candidatus Omnitrophica bacterium]|nr:4-hydroxythreonine-4-phosphate dehydrogenase PdxA [Candidatus Omnitrophota bacterium]